MARGYWRWAVGIGLAACISLGASGHDRHAHMEEGVRKVAEKRHDTMNAFGRAMRELKNFVERGRGSPEAASGAADVIAAGAPTIPSLFPEGTGPDAIPKSESKPSIWEEWDAFVAASGLLGDKAAAMKAAIASGDAGRMSAAFGDLGKEGCGGCHRKFREKKD